MCNFTVHCVCSVQLLSLGPRSAGVITLKQIHPRVNYVSVQCAAEDISGLVASVMVVSLSSHKTLTIMVLAHQGIS